MAIIHAAAAPETKVFLLLFLQKKKNLLSLKRKKQRNFNFFAASATAKSPLAHAIPRRLAFPEKHLPRHGRGFGVKRVHMRDIGVVIRHADHQIGRLNHAAAGRAQVKAASEASADHSSTPAW
jgi:hypothetical protein